VISASNVQKEALKVQQKWFERKNSSNSEEMVRKEKPVRTKMVRNKNGSNGKKKNSNGNVSAKTVRTALTLSQCNGSNPNAAMIQTIRVRCLLSPQDHS
jgi:ADP-ribosylglycohydrolase